MRLIPTSPLSTEFSPMSNPSEITVVSIVRHGSWFVPMALPPPGGVLGDQAPPHHAGVHPP